MDNQKAKKLGELRGRKKDKSYKKLSKRKVRYDKDHKDDLNKE